MSKRTIPLIVTLIIISVILLIIESRDNLGRFFSGRKSPLEECVDSLKISDTKNDIEMKNLRRSTDSLKRINDSIVKEKYKNK